MQHAEITYCSNTIEVFEKFAHEPWAIFFDSGFPAPCSGRYDIILLRPYKTITTLAGKTTIQDEFNENISHDNPFELINEIYKLMPQHPNLLPFYGGMAGYFGYDLAWQLEHLPDLKTPDICFPELAFGCYAIGIITDHIDKKTFLLGPNQQQIDAINAQLTDGKLPAENDFKLTSKMQSNLSFDEYANRFNRIKQYIQEGDCYQVNLTQRFKASYKGNSWHAYKSLRAINPSPFAAFMNLPHGQILSLSPERFIQIDHHKKVTTSPIKGTQPRSNDPDIDKAHQESLLASEKDHAENVMIVDLLRNDLSKSCELNSVKTTKLCELESFAYVHHLVSTIEAQLKSDKTAFDAVKHAFPGGSITGAPKIRAMQIIEELEPTKRNIYTGSIGFYSNNGYFDSNIAIRTFVCQNDTIYGWAGGGIVADSTLEAEHKEAWAKISLMAERLESL